MKNIEDAHLLWAVIYIRIGSTVFETVPKMLEDLSRITCRYQGIKFKSELRELVKKPKTFELDYSTCKSSKDMNIGVVDRWWNKL